MRIPVIAANWKLNKTIQEAQAFIHDFKPLVQSVSNVEIVVCPVFTALATVSEAAKDSNISIGAQDIFWKDSGAYTGEVSAPLLEDAGCTYVIIGHSERRGRFGVPEADLQGDAGKVFGDTDASVNAKIKTALSHNLIPIICVGETLDEREANRTDSVIEAQVKAALDGIDGVEKTIFAYEPVWAIGTGKTCDSKEAGRVCGFIRSVFKNVTSQEVSDAVRIQYGGSVKGENAAELLSHPDIDGALVGGASLKADTFAPIVEAAAR
ncbi:MAG: triose-phosphate isomerase [Abditibacteriaceae bacterium]